MTCCVLYDFYVFHQPDYCSCIVSCRFVIVGAIGGNTSSPSQSSAGEPRAALERSTSSSSSSSGAGPKKTRGEVPKDCQIEDFSNYSMDHVNLRRLSYTSLRKFCAQVSCCIFRCHHPFEFDARLGVGVCWTKCSASSPWLANSAFDAFGL